MKKLIKAVIIFSTVSLAQAGTTCIPWSGSKPDSLTWCQHFVAGTAASGLAGLWSGEESAKWGGIGAAFVFTARELQQGFSIKSKDDWMDLLSGYAGAWVGTLPWKDSKGIIYPWLSSTGGGLQYMEQF